MDYPNNGSKYRQQQATNFASVNTGNNVEQATLTGDGIHTTIATSNMGENNNINNVRHVAGQPTVSEYYALAKRQNMKQDA